MYYFHIFYLLAIIIQLFVISQQVSLVSQQVSDVQDKVYKICKESNMSKPDKLNTCDELVSLLREGKLDNPVVTCLDEINKTVHTPTQVLEVALYLEDDVDIILFIDRYMHDIYGTTGLGSFPEQPLMINSITELSKEGQRQYFYILLNSYDEICKKFKGNSKRFSSDDLFKLDEVLLWESFRLLFTYRQVVQDRVRERE